MALLSCVYLAYLVKLLLLLLEVGHDLSEVVLVYLQVIQLLLETRLCFIQLLVSGAFLLQALVHSLQVPLKLLLSLLSTFQRASILLRLLLQFSKLRGGRDKVMSAV